MVQEIVAVSQNRMRRIVGKLGLRSTIALSEVLDWQGQDQLYNSGCGTSLPDPTPISIPKPESDSTLMSKK